MVVPANQGSRRSARHAPWSQQPVGGEARQWGPASRCGRWTGGACASVSPPFIADRPYRLYDFVKLGRGALKGANACLPPIHRQITWQEQQVGST